MPQQGTQQSYRILLAQAEGGEHGASTGAHGAAAGETHASQGHGGGGHEPVNPLAEHHPLGYSLNGGIVALVLIIIAFLGTRSLKKRPTSRLQLLLEYVYDFLNTKVRDAIGPGGERFTPLVGTIFLFVLFSNLFGLLPFSWFRHGPEANYAGPAYAPTANLSMTIALALVVFFTVQSSGIRANGVGGHLKHLAGPVPALSWLIFPLELIGELAKPVSLSIRLFGNIFGEETVIAVLITLAATVLPAFLPIPFQAPMMIFGVFTALVQAAVFSILTCAYIALSVGEHSEHAEHHDEAHPEQTFGHESVVP